MDARTKKIALYILAATLGAQIGYLIALNLVSRMDAEKNDHPQSDEEDTAEEIIADSGYIAVSNEVTADTPAPAEAVDYTKYSKTARAVQKRASRYMAEHPEEEDVTVSVRKAAKKYLGKSSLEIPEEDAITEEEVEEVDSDYPYILSMYDYVDPENTQEKTTLNYYEEDDVLTDASDTVIPEPEKILGETALVNFGKGSNDPDVVYVRNHENNTDYEVVRIRRSYQEAVLGLTEKKPARTRKARKVDAED